MKQRLVTRLSAAVALIIGLSVQIVFAKPNDAQTSPKTKEIIKQLEALEPEFPTWRPVEGGKTISELREISKAYGAGKVKSEAIMPYKAFEKKFMNGGSMPSLDPKRPLLVIEADGNAPWERHGYRVEKPNLTIALDAKTGQLVHKVVGEKLPESSRNKPLLTSDSPEIQKEQAEIRARLQKEEAEAKAQQEKK
jgi:hypothetical protein